MRTLGLLLFGAALVTGGWQQVREPHPRAARARDSGLPVSDELVRASGWAMILGAIALHIRPLRPLAALLLAIQLVPITYVGHRFWELEPGPNRFSNRTHFFKNVSIIGAALVIAAWED